LEYWSDDQILSSYFYPIFQYSSIPTFHPSSLTALAVNPALFRCFSVLVIGCAGSFCGDHAGSYRVFRGADPAEERAFPWQKNTPENLSTSTPGTFGTRCDVNLEGPGCVKTRVFLPDPQAAPGDDAQTPPLRITWFKDLVHDGEGGLVALGKDAPGISVIDPRLLLPGLKNEHADSPEDVERFESGHGHGDMILFGQEVPGP
jgi:hypothetical protein